MVGTFRVEAKVTADCYVLKPNVDAVHKVLVAFAIGLLECDGNLETISHFTAESFVKRLGDLGFEVTKKAD